MKALGPEGYLDAVAIFYELDDTQLERIKTDKEFYLDTKFLISCNYSKGNNAHFVTLYSNGTKSELIPKHLQLLLKEYKTVSWWDRDMGEFKIIGGK